MHHLQKNERRLLSSCVQLVGLFSLTKNMESKCRELHLGGADCPSL